MNGWLLIDKPGGITSRDVVNQVQKWFPRRTKLGHTGTLDPLATGLLVLAVGAATRLAEAVQEQGKCYESLFRLGATSDTDDADGTVTPFAEANPLEESVIRQALTAFQGEVMQVPPGYSAILVQGQRAYDLARAGEIPELKPRPIQIYGMEWLSYTWPDLFLRISCGKGTYIRSIARDLGQALRCGGYVQTLRRTRVGGFRVEDALPISATREDAQARLLTIDAALTEWPAIELNEQDARRFLQGQALATPQSPTERLRVYGPHFLGTARIEAGLIKPTRVLNSSE